MALRIDTVPEKTEAEKATGLNRELQLPGQNRAPRATDRMFFTEQLALLLETGESLYGALTTIVTQTEHPKMREIVERVAQVESSRQPWVMKYLVETLMEADEGEDPIYLTEEESGALFLG